MPAQDYVPVPPPHPSLRETLSNVRVHRQTRRKRPKAATEPSIPGVRPPIRLEGETVCANAAFVWRLSVNPVQEKGRQEMSDTHGARDNQQIWSRARTKLAESLQTIYDKIELLPNKTGRPQAALELGVDEQIGSLEHVIPIFAKFKEDVPSKNITELWPIFIKSWNKLKESRPQSWPRI